MTVLLAIALSVVAVLYVIESAAWAAVLRKIGLPARRAWVPFRKIPLLNEVAGRGRRGWILSWYRQLAHDFGKGESFVWGLVLCEPVFLLILGVGRAEYHPSDGRFSSPSL